MNVAKFAIDGGKSVRAKPLPLEFPGVHHLITPYPDAEIAQRIETKSSAKGVRCIAFKTPEGGLVAQLLNSRKATTEMRLESGGRALRLTRPVLSITTCLWKPAEGERP